MLEKYLPQIDFDSYEDFMANYRLNIPADFNFGFDIIDAWADKEPDKVAIVWCNDYNEEYTFTYSDLKKKSNQTANMLKSLGIGKGDRVMLVLRRRYEYWLAAIALHKLGAILIPSTMLLTSKDIIYRANAANIKAAICFADDFVIEQTEGAMADSPTIKHKIIVAGNKDGWLNFDDIKNFSEEFARPTGEAATKADDIMLIYFTSGTTGMPKMVMHDFTHPLGHIITAKYWHQVRPNQMHLAVSDSGWGKFGWGKFWGQFICGAIVFTYDMDKFIPAKLLEKLQQYPIKTFCAPPTIFRFMLAAGMENYDLSSIEHCNNAGEPLNADIFNKINDILGMEMAEGFGQTETTLLIGNFPWFKPRVGSMGKPSPLYDVDLINSEGNSCEDGEEGEIVVRNLQAIGLFKGYFENEELTKNAFSDNMYNTGDIAWRDPEGYYWFVGRNDDVIKCSGYRIGPFEVESALVEHESVLECAVTGAPDEKRGQVVKATIVLKEGYQPSEQLVAELQEFVKNLTAPYKYPRIIDFVSELPKTVSGKIKRAEIRQSNYN